KKLNLPLYVNTMFENIPAKDIFLITDKILGAMVTNVGERTADLLIKRISHISTIAFSKIPTDKKGNFFVGVSHASATKQHGILEAAKILGIKTHEIIGVGDGDNDFPLLMACGMRVAMGNAVNGLKEIADYIAPPVFEDGVVDVINRFILKDKVK
ncbi:MAG: HAD hydrolase family protein, partial [Patescibacteria group bacterium]